MNNQLTKQTPLNTLIKFLHPNPKDMEVFIYPFQHGETLLFLGEMPQMPGHCVVAMKTGQVFWGYDIDNFIILSEDEV